MSTNISLTSAQQDHLQRLVDNARNANSSVEAFIAYLREEHNAPDGLWDLHDLGVGFTEKASPNGPPPEMMEEQPMQQPPRQMAPQN